MWLLHFKKNTLRENINMHYIKKSYEEENMSWQCTSILLVFLILIYAHYIKKNCYLNIWY
jgi:hypothetical protein